MAEGCQFQNHNPVTGEPLDCGGGQSQCRLCRHWRKQEPVIKTKDNGGKRKDWRDLRRRCAYHTDFYSLPNYLCRAFASGGKNKCRKTG